MRSRNIILFSILVSVLLVGFLPNSVYADFKSTGTGSISGTGTSFEVTDSTFLNVKLTSTESVILDLTSIPELIEMNIQSNSGATSSQITITGFNPGTTYYKYEDDLHNKVVFTADSTGSYNYTQDLSQSHEVFIQTQPSTKFISTPSGGDCSTIGTWNSGTSTCTLTSNVSQTIEIDSNSVILDGNGHSLTHGTSGSIGVLIPRSHNNIQVKGLTITGWSIGIQDNSNNDIIQNNSITGNSIGVSFTGNAGQVLDNTISGNSNTGIQITGNNAVIKRNIISSNGVGINISGNGNQIINNDFISNTHQVTVNEETHGNLFDGGAVPPGGNYWSDFSPTCADANHDLICDTKYQKEHLTDNFPWKLQDGWTGVAPTVAVTQTPAPNVAGWNNADVTVHFTVTGTPTPTPSCPDVIVSTETPSQTVTCSVSNFVGSASASATVKLDKTAPTTAIGSVTGDGGVAIAPGSITTSKSVSIPFTRSDALSSVASSACTLDDGTPAACSTPFTASALADGPHTLTISSTDNAGNTEHTATFSWTIVSPTISLDLTKYLIESAGVVTVTDVSASGTVFVHVNSDSDPGVDITLHETAVGSHTFTNLNTNPIPPGPDNSVTLTFTAGSDSTSATNVNLHVVVTNNINAVYAGKTATAQIVPAGGFGGTAPPSTDIVRFVESNAYTLAQAATIQVNDPSVPSATTSVTVNVKSTSDGTGFALTLNRDSPTATTFTATTLLTFIQSPATSISTTGALQAAVGNTITATYGSNTPVTASIIADTTTVYPPGFTPDTTVRATCTGDTDGDGICDNWEDQGVASGINIPSTLTGVAYTLSCDPAATYASDPLGDLVCPQKGKKDIYVQVDYMTGQKPDNTALANVVNAFANSGVTGSPTNGIALHIFVVNQIPFQQNTYYNTDPTANPTFVALKLSYFGTASEKTCPAVLPAGIPDCSTYTTKLLTAKRQIFHYAMFVHDQGEDKFSSGYGDRPGNDIVVSLGEFANHVGSIDQQAGTFMHELGHNLGLFHGGNEDLNCKPNYPSVMQYALQFDKSSGGFLSGRALDYSRTSYASINENSLSESTAAMTSTVRGLPARTTEVGGWTGTAAATPFAQALATTVNWDQATGPTTYSRNVHYFNMNGCKDTTLTTLTSFDDWHNLVFSFRGYSTFDSGAETGNAFDDSSSSNTNPTGGTTTDPGAAGSINPSVIPPADPYITKGQSISTSATIVDPNNAAWDVTINYGDGTTVGPTHTTSTTIPLSHLYNTVGNIPVTITVTNNLGGSDTGTFTVHVNDIATFKTEKAGISNDIKALESGITNTDTIKKLDRAAQHVTDSVAAILWQSDGKHLTSKGKMVFNDESHAVKDLMIVIKKAVKDDRDIKDVDDDNKIDSDLSTTQISLPSSFSSSANLIMVHLVNIDKRIADTAAADAVKHLADVTNANAKKKIQDRINKITENEIKADDAISKGDYSRAIHYYRIAWSNAQDALAIS